jgi:hypothetical protein
MPMTNRQRLAKVRNDLHDLASDLQGIAMDVESRNAATLMERARKLVLAAHHEADAAMRQPLDPTPRGEIYEDGMANSRDTSVLGWSS